MLPVSRCGEPGRAVGRFARCGTVWAAELRARMSSDKITSVNAPALCVLGFLDVHGCHPHLCHPGGKPPVAGWAYCSHELPAVDIQPPPADFSSNLSNLAFNAAPACNIRRRSLLSRRCMARAMAGGSAVQAGAPQVLPCALTYEVWFERYNLGKAPRIYSHAMKVCTAGVACMLDVQQQKCGCQQWMPSQSAGRARSCAVQQHTGASSPLAACARQLLRSSVRRRGRRSK